MYESAEVDISVQEMSRFTIDKFYIKKKCCVLARFLKAMIPKKIRCQFGDFLAVACTGKILFACRCWGSGHRSMIDCFGEESCTNLTLK